MTREEAIKELKEMIDYEWNTYQTKTAKIYVEALTMAIEALEQVSKLQRLTEMFKQEGHKPIRTISMEDLQEFIK